VSIYRHFSHRIIKKIISINLKLFVAIRLHVKFLYYGHRTEEIIS